MRSVTPGRSRPGVGSFHFARRYSGNRCCFLFLRVLRCFSSPGSLRHTMYSCECDWSSTSRVSPFGYLRISVCLRLPAAFRSWPRPSSAFGALASTLCSSSLDYSPETNVSVSLSFTYFDWSFDSLFFPLQLSRCAGAFAPFSGLPRGILKTIRDQFYDLSLQRGSCPSSAVSPACPAGPLGPFDLG